MDGLMIIHGVEHHGEFIVRRRRIRCGRCGKRISRGASSWVITRAGAGGEIERLTRCEQCLLFHNRRTDAVAIHHQKTSDREVSRNEGG